MPSAKSRYMDSAPTGGGGGGDSRYADRNSGSGGSSAWTNAGPVAVKSFGGGGGGGASNHMQSSAGGGGDLWGGPKQTDASNWRSMDQNQDRYDRTYNERKSQAAPSQYMDPPQRQNSFVGGRPQDRYNTGARFENGGGGRF